MFLTLCIQTQIVMSHPSFILEVSTIYCSIKSAKTADDNYFHTYCYLVFTLDHEKEILISSQGEYNFDETTWKNISSSANQ